MDSTKYVGRVGALAVALGIGSAVATTPWVAVAEPSVDSSSASDSSSSSTSSGTADSTSTADAKPETSVDNSGGAGGETDTSDIAEPIDEKPAASTEGDTSATPGTPEPTASEPATGPESSTPEQSPISETPAPSPATEPVALTEPSDNDGPAAAQPVTVGPPPSAPEAVATPLPSADSGAGAHAVGGAGAARQPAATVTLTQASRTAATGSSVAELPATAAAAQVVPAEQAAPASPTGVVSSMVSGFLAWMGLSPGLTHAPAAPAQSPLLWGLLEWARRQVRHTFFNRTPTTAYNPAGNSQSADGVITGDLHVVDPDGDPLTFTVTQAPEHGSLVVNRDGTFTYTPDAEFRRTAVTDTFTVVVDDSAAYRLPGVAGWIQDLVHRGAQVLGVSGADAVDSHPTVEVNPVIATIDVGDGPTSAVVSPNGTTVYVANTFGDPVSVIDTATNTVTGTIAVGNDPVQGVAVSPDGTRLYVTNASDGTVSVIDTATNTVIDTINVGDNPAESRSAPTAPAPTSATSSATRCR